MYLSKHTVIFITFVLATVSYSESALGQSAAEKECKLLGVKFYTNQELFSRFNSTKSCSDIPENGKVSVFYPVAVERLQLLSWEFYTRLQTGAITRNTPQVLYYYGDLKDAYNEFVKRGTGSRSYNKLYLDQATSNLQRIADYLGQSGRVPTVTKSSAQP